MCGIVGIFGLINKTRISMFEDMLAMDGLRGKDSTGVAVITPQSVDVIKDIVLADDLLDRSEYKQARSNKNLLCLIGHNRAATFGKVVQDNAHPFRHKHITMVHNGTLMNRWRLPYWQSCETDSEALAHCIAEYGIEKAWAVTEGAATLVWWDDNQKTLNFISNNKRPFFMHPLKSNDGIVWASEKWIFEVAAARLGIEFENPEKTYTPVDGLLYSFVWKPDKKQFHFTEKQLEPFKVGNGIPGYDAFAPISKKKQKHKHKRTGGMTFKPASESAAVFSEWKGQYLQRNPDKSDTSDDFSDEAIKARYPELFDASTTSRPLKANGHHADCICTRCDNLNNGTDADLDTRAVPFRPKTEEIKSHSGKNVRTHERFKQLFDLVEINSHGKHMQAEYFLVNYKQCCECSGPFNYNDFFTARILSESRMLAICDLCQMDAWVGSGLEPDQIRLQ